MQNSSNDVSLFIATTADSRRANSLKRAIQSALNQTYPYLRVIVIINGGIFDAKVRQYIESNRKIDSYYLKIGSFPEALKFARSIVKTKYFCFLDDDDELLPNSVYERAQKLNLNSKLDVAVTNGLIMHNGLVEYHAVPLREFSKFRADPLSSLFLKNGNWLASCAGMFRTQTVGVEYFQDYAKYAEWSYLAVRLSINKRVELIQSDGYIIHKTDVSLSNSFDYYIYQHSYLQKILVLSLPYGIRKTVYKKISDSHHTLADMYVKKSNYRKAWYHHLLSMASFYGFKKYMLSTINYLRAYS